ncbi:MAG: transglutaminase domain-containing protein [Planctomycetales bacterium]
MRNTIALSLLKLALLLLVSSSAMAQFVDSKKDADSNGIRLAEETTVRLKVGIIVESKGSALKGVVGSTPVPIDWPEQQVKVISEDTSSAVRRVKYENIGGTVKRMVVTIPTVRRNNTVQAMVTYEITRYHILAPDKPDQFSIPKKPGRKIKQYLGSSPYIETRNNKIKKMAREITQKVNGSDWKKVEAMYDWVRDNIQYKEGPLKGATAALKDGTGDCEEMTSLFIAMCRINNVPARTVWIPGHCYPEFYLEDKDGQGHWFPCQVAGTRAFGSMPEHRPILQKGDNFKVPESKERKRYVAEHLKVADAPGGNKPRVQFVREILAD